jgi:hypothetical protein
MELEPGAVAERLGRGLQSPVQRFESAPRLFAGLSTSDQHPLADRVAWKAA